MIKKLQEGKNLEKGFFSPVYLILDFPGFVQRTHIL